MADRILNDYGQTLEISCPDVDFAGADSVEICVVKPTGERRTWTPTGVDEVTRVVSYVYQSGDLDRVGFYEIHVHAIYAAASIHTEAFSLEVAEIQC